MVQRTIRLVREQNPNVDITVATSVQQVEALGLQMQGEYELSLEPQRRGTAPAIMLAASHIAWKQGADPNSTVVVMPIDTFADSSYYANIAKLDNAVQAEEGNIILLGVEPTYPSQKYGYIVPEANHANDAVKPVIRFMEKPDESLAAELIGQGALWNCGVFAFKLSYLMSIIGSYSTAESYEDLRSSYAGLPTNSFDYEVVERTAAVAVIPYSGTWKDLGTWNTLTEEFVDLYAGKVWADEGTLDNVHVCNETGMPLVVAGLSNVVVAATPDGILVSGKEESAHIKELVEEAAAIRPMYERKCWGEYRVIDEGAYRDGSHVLTKELVLLPGEQLPYQRHANRTVVLVVTDGEGEIVRDGEVFAVKVGDSVSIVPGQMHASRAISELHIVEVQIGCSLAEDEIENLGNYWV